MVNTVAQETKPIKVIRAALARAREQGIRVGPRHWGTRRVNKQWVRSSSASVCPLGAVLLGTSTKRVKAQAALAEALGVSENWVLGFLAGFDGWKGFDMNQDRELGYCCGRLFRPHTFTGPETDPDLRFMGPCTFCSFGADSHE